jgi:hypothetical protein
MPRLFAAAGSLLRVLRSHPEGNSRSRSSKPDVPPYRIQPHCLRGAGVAPLPPQCCGQQPSRGPERLLAARQLCPDGVESLPGLIDLDNLCVTQQVGEILSIVVAKDLLGGLGLLHPIDKPHPGNHLSD